MESSAQTAPTAQAPRQLRRLERPAIAGVMSREVSNFLTYWKGTTFSSVLEPLVYLLAFGLDPEPGMLLVPLFCFVTALGFAGFGVAMAATV
nr:hypothetical protein [Actinomycetota bacterium]